MDKYKAFAMNDTRLLLQEIGIYAKFRQVLGNREHVTRDEVAAVCTIGRGTFDSCFQTLRKYHYIKMIRGKNKATGKYFTFYVLDTPDGYKEVNSEIQLQEKPYTKNSSVKDIDIDLDENGKKEKKAESAPTTKESDFIDYFVPAYIRNGRYYDPGAVLNAIMEGLKDRYSTLEAKKILTRANANYEKAKGKILYTPWGYYLQIVRMLALNWVVGKMPVKKKKATEKPAKEAMTDSDKPKMPTATDNTQSATTNNENKSVLEASTGASDPAAVAAVEPEGNKLTYTEFTPNSHIRFNNFHQRQYDDEIALERMLLLRA